MEKKKEFTYRGKTISELKELDVRSFSKYLKARARRTAIRNFQEIENFVKRAKEKSDKKKKIKTHKRDLIIVPTLIGMTIHVHNGKEFFPVEIINEMLGHRLGEFALTRSKVTHTKAGVGATKGTKHKAKK